MSVQHLIFCLLTSSSILTVAATANFQETSAVLINASSLFDGAESSRHVNLTMGRRKNGDKLAGSYSVEVPPHPWSISMLFRTFQVGSGQSITQVHVANLEKRLYTSCVAHIFGGPRFRSVGLLFVSKINAGLSFLVRIYAI